MRARTQQRCGHRLRSLRELTEKPLNALHGLRAVAVLDGAGRAWRAAANVLSLRSFFVVIGFTASVACASGTQPNAQTAGRGRGQAPHAEPWPGGNAPFHSDAGWLGADAAYSIDLDALHVLWLFADTFLDPAQDGSRTNGPNFFIRNSVGLQTGPTPEGAHDLSQSQLKFYWGPKVTVPPMEKGAAAGSAPSSFFHDLDGAERWVWPLHGARLPGGELLVFRMQVVKDSGGVGFRLESWDAVAIDDPLSPPEHWSPRIIRAAAHPFGKLVGSSVLIHDGQLYAYAVDETGQGHAIYLVRWPLAQLAGLTQGALDDPEWWTERGFVKASALPEGVAPKAVFGEGQVELSVHWDERRQRFVELQMMGLFALDPKTQIGMRTAGRPEGPWSEPTAFFTPKERELDNAKDLIAYAAKAHPEQRGPGLVVTYVVNDLKRFPPADVVYYPQLLRLSN